MSDPTEVLAKALCAAAEMGVNPCPNEAKHRREAEFAMPALTAAGYSLRPTAEWEADAERLAEARAPLTAQLEQSEAAKDALTIRLAGESFEVERWVAQAEAERAAAEQAASREAALEAQLAVLVDEATVDGPCRWCGFPLHALNCPITAHNLSYLAVRHDAQVAQQAVGGLFAWVERHRTPSDGDWACAECRPESGVLTDGFRCAYHEVAALLHPDIGPTPEEAE